MRIKVFIPAQSWYIHANLAQRVFCLHMMDENYDLLCFHFMMKAAESYTAEKVCCENKASWQVAVLSHLVEDSGSGQAVYFFEELVR